MSPFNPHKAVSVYAKVAKESASPRDLEADLLLKAAAKLQAVQDSWSDKQADLAEAILYNRRLWIVFMDAVMREDNGHRKCFKRVAAAEC